MKRCAVWGTRMAGQELAREAAYIGAYEVVAYCSSTQSSQGALNGYPVLSPEELKNQYLAGKIDSILVGIQDPVHQQEVEKIIKQTFPPDVSVIWRDSIENEYLIQVRNNLPNHWIIDFEQQARIWLKNFSSEIDFWVNCVVNPNGRFYSDYINRIRNQDFLGIDLSAAAFARKLKAGSVVMDIGCGLAPKYGSRLPTSEMIQMISVDALAPFYNPINQKCTGGRVGKCRFGMFEFIANFFDENYCDGILINNALDHCIDPYKSIIECLYVLKTGRSMRMVHHRAEAVREGYGGLHKWNIDYNGNNDFIIWNRENAVNISENLREIADIEVVHPDDDTPRNGQYVAVDITKKEDFPLEIFFDTKQEQRQLAFLVEGLMNWIAEHNEEFLKALQNIQELNSL